MIVGGKKTHLMTTAPLHTVSVTTLAQQGLVVGKPRQSTYPLSYRRDATTLEPVVCQTPWLWLPMPPRYVTRQQRRRVHFFHVVFQPQVDGTCEWVQFLQHIQHALHEWVRRKHHTSSSLQWVNTLETIRPQFSDSHDEAHEHETRWKISTQLHKTAQCYDVTGAPMSFQTFRAPPFAPQYVRLLVQFTHVWVNTSSGTCGLALNVLQLQHDTVQAPYVCAFSSVDTRRPCVSVGTQTDNVVLSTVSPAAAATAMSQRQPPAAATRCTHPLYGKYFKMLQKGVPKPAVQHKMRMNGVDITVLDLPSDAPLPCVAAADTLKHASADLLRTSLQDTQHLRKTEINADRPKGAAKSGAGHGFSLGEIVNGLQSLRKTLWGTKRKTDTRDAAVEDDDDNYNAGAIRVDDNDDCHAAGSSSASSTPSFLELLGKRVNG